MPFPHNQRVIIDGIVESSGPNGMLNVLVRTSRNVRTTVRIHESAVRATVPTISRKPANPNPLGLKEGDFVKRKHLKRSRIWKVEKVHVDKAFITSGDEGMLADLEMLIRSDPPASALASLPVQPQEAMIGTV